MDFTNEVFAKYEDEDGETYYCSINSVADDHIVSEWELDNCVEVFTAERYLGTLNRDRTTQRIRK